MPFGDDIVAAYGQEHDLAFRSLAPSELALGMHYARHLDAEKSMHPPWAPSVAPAEFKNVSAWQDT